MAKNKLTKEQRKVTIEELKDLAIETREREERVILTETERKFPSSTEIVGVPHRAQRAKFARLLEVLEQIIESAPQGKLKHSDIIAAIKLSAQLQGMLSTHKEEKHLHLHGNDLRQVSESDLRRQLADLEQAKSSSETDAVAEEL